MSMSQAMPVVGVPPAPPEPPSPHPCYDATVAATGIDPENSSREILADIEAAKAQLRKALGS